MKKINFIFNILLFISIFILITTGYADDIATIRETSEEILIKGTVVQVEDVCGIIADDRVYIIPCYQVENFNDKIVNVIGAIIEEGEVPTIDATSVQTIE